MATLMEKEALIECPMAICASIDRMEEKLGYQTEEMKQDIESLLALRHKYYRTDENLLDIDEEFKTIKSIRARYPRDKY